ncbi:hypothetical protein GCM10010124_25540 [Pilimelia terevasa]|uniref:Uncharacterized protein n=1 Tax=Pilimelia terevasa TaxID=53372 RepID=A0A8J3BSA4_9ACTN|nr:hypothetical protein [Pilimelia terevasa]GGK31643.1 hypothetical protein GCM10010124_25540 [Pilimelia terevasa]
MNGTITDAAEVSVLVLYSHFTLQINASPDAPDIDFEQTVADINESLVTLMSGDSGHRAAVRVELLAASFGAPMPPAETLVVAGQVISDGSPLLLAGVTTGEVHELFAPPAGRYVLRVTCSGRDRMLAELAAGRNADGVERWLIQMWPAGSVMPG